MKCFGNRKVNFIIKLVLLDDQEVIQEIQRTSRGQELLDNVFKHLNIIETAYFGLRFLDANGQPHWLDGSKTVIKQISDTRTLYFGVKFYAADPCKLAEELTRYQFFLQIKKDIYQGRLSVPAEQCAELAAFAVQSELGDFDPRRHVPGYISEFRFVANQSEDMEKKIADIHKALIGQVPAVAELNYLEKVKWLDMYGVDLHPVLGEDKIDYFLGLMPSAIIVLRNKTKVGNYFWPRITKLSIKGKYFMIRVKSRAEEQTYGFETPSKSACKHLWRSASEHHTFFRLVQVTPNPNSNKSFSLGSRFRDSRSSDSSARRRAQPQFIRTPSRKYTRRYVEGAADNDPPSTTHQSQIHESKAKDWTLKQDQERDHRDHHHHREPSSPKSTKSTKSSKSVQVNSRKYSVPSPRSSRSMPYGHGHGHSHSHNHSHRRSQSVESNSSVESVRRHSRRRERKKSSDGESENSTRSNKKRYRHRRSSGGTGGSDSESCRHRRSHSHHHSEPVRWKEATMTVPAVQSISNVIDLNSKENGSQTNPNTSSNTQNSNSSHRSKRRSSHHARKKEKPVLSEEIKKHLDFELIDTSGMSYEELRRIGYKRVDVGHHDRDLILPGTHSVGHSGQEPKIKTQLQLLTGEESPPPPYSNYESPSVGQPQQQQQQQQPPSQQQQQLGLPSSKSLATASHHHPVSSSYNNTAVLSKELKLPLQAESPSVKRLVSTEKYHNHLNQNHNQNMNLQHSNNHHQPQYNNHNSNPNQGRSTYDEISSQSPTQSLSVHLKQDIFHDNSDSGLGTDREYYRGGNLSNLSYTLNRRNNNGAEPQTQSSHTYNNHEGPASEYWNSSKMNTNEGCDLDFTNWNPNRSNGQPLDNHHHNGSQLIEQRNNVPSSSLEMILSPLLSSTRTRL